MGSGAGSREPARRWLWSISYPLSPAATSSELVLGGRLALRGGGRVGSALEAMAFYLVQLAPLRSETPAVCVQRGALWTWQRCRRALVCGNCRAPGRGECGHPHMLLWRQPLPMPPPGLSTGCVFPPEVRNMTAAGPACSVHPGGVLEARLAPRRWLVREWRGMAARAGAAAPGSTGELLGGLCAASG